MGVFLIFSSHLYILGILQGRDRELGHLLRGTSLLSAKDTANESASDFPSLVSVLSKALSESIFRLIT